MAWEATPNAVYEINYHLVWLTWTNEARHAPVTLAGVSEGRTGFAVGYTAVGAGGRLSRT